MKTLTVKGDAVRRGVTLEAGDVRVYVTASEARFVLVGPRNGEAALFDLTAAGIERVDMLLDVVKGEMYSLKAQFEQAPDA